MIAEGKLLVWRKENLRSKTCDIKSRVAFQDSDGGDELLMVQKQYDGLSSSFRRSLPLYFNCLAEDLG